MLFHETFFKSLELLPRCCKQSSEKIVLEHWAAGAAKIWYEKRITTRHEKVKTSNYILACVWPPIYHCATIKPSLAGGTDRHKQKNLASDSNTILVVEIWETLILTGSADLIVFEWWAVMRSERISIITLSKSSFASLNSIWYLGDKSSLKHSA